VDSSAAQALGGIFKMASRRGVQVSVSRLSASLQETLVEARCFGDSVPEIHDGIDAVITAWDEKGLARMVTTASTFETWLAQTFPSRAMAQQVIEYFELVTLQAGETLFSQGDPSDALYLVRSGRLSAHTIVDGQEIKLLAILVGGAIGEMGLFRSVPRSSTIRAEQESVLMQLSRKRLEEMESHRPELAAALLRQFLRQLSNRLDRATSRAHALSV